MAQRKSTVDEAWPGDIVGLPDNGIFKIGDTLTEGEVLHFRGLPSFSPELFKYIENDDPMKSKQFQKGIEQLMNEGVAQMFINQFNNRRIIGTVGIARDVTKEYEYLQNIEHLAHYDQLTGLANRNQLDAFLDNLKTTHMSILYMDLDRFKQVNDEHGHQAGDKALVAIAELIKEIFNDAMNVRIGGDEFISIFTDGANMQSPQSNRPKLDQNLIHFKNI